MRRIRSLLRLQLPLLALLTALAPTGAAARLALDYYTRHDDVDFVRIAPDGNALAVAVHEADESRVSYLRLPDLGEEASMRASAGTDIGQIQWISAHEFVYTLRAREPQRLVLAPDGMLYAVRSVAQRSEVTSFRFGNKRDYVSADILEQARPGDGRVLIVEHPWQRSKHGYRYDADVRPTLALVDIDAHTKTALEMLPLRDARVVLDGRDAPARLALGIAGDGRRVVQWKPASAWQPWDPAGFRAETLQPRAYDGAARTLLFTGAPDGAATIGLYRLNLGNGSITRLYADETADVDAVLTDFARGDVVGALVDSGPPSYHFLDPQAPTAQLYGLVQRAFPGHGVRISSATADQHLVAAFVYSDVDPGAYYLVDTGSHHATLLFARRSWTDPAQMRPMESAQLRARDGTPLHVFLTRPRDSAGPFPLIVLPHDDPLGSADRWGFDWEVQLLANAGYAVLQVNYRGSTGYGPDFHAAGLGEWGAKVQDDVTDATRWAIDTGIAAKGRVCIYGRGYGGYAALMGAAREPELHRCAASYGGISDLELLFEQDGMTAPAGDALSAMVGTDRALLRARSPASAAARIEAAVLLVHDQSDPEVSFEQARRMHSALLAADKAVTMESLHYGQHEVYEQSRRNLVYGKLLAFFDQALADTP